MTAYISPIANGQFFDADGNPLVGGKVYTYAEGTTTPIDAYTTNVGDVSQANPAILNTLGALDDPLYLAQGVGYKIVVKDADDVPTGMEYDHIYGVEETTAPSEWVLYTGEFSYLSSTTFSVVGDQTQVFQTNRHLKTLVTAGTAYHIVSSATYSAPDTTVTVTNTFLSLDTGLNQLYYGFFAPDNSSIPESAIGTAIRTATSQAAARATLGSTATGDALFTTASASAARTTLDVYSKSETDTKLDNPAFSAYVAANQTITSSTSTKVNFDTEEFDIGSCYDTTLKRWTPNKAGYYQVSMTVNDIISVSPTVFVVSIYKNGTSLKQGGDIRGALSGSITSSALIYMNGTTDYLEGYAYITATTPTITSDFSYFSAFFVRA